MEEREHEAIDQEDVNEAAGAAPESTSEAEPDLRTRLEESESTVLRLMADFENLRRRTSERELRLREEVVAEVVGLFLPVVDNLDRALSADGTGLKEGVALTADAFRQTLDRLGVKEIQAEGAHFDPHAHEALAEEASDVPDGTILEVFRPGYRLGDRLLRPALVKVARAAGDDA